ncbi:MAG: amino acid permease [Deltaproteobacteria bacterium]
MTAPRRALGFGDLVLFYIVTGISLRWIATAATAGPSAVTIWLVAWLAFYVPLALSVVELSSRQPEEGGLYIWSKRAFGDFAGFMTGWASWTCNLPYYPSILYFTAGNALFLGGARGRRSVPAPAARRRRRSARRGGGSARGPPGQAAVGSRLPASRRISRAAL